MKQHFHFPLRLLSFCLSIILCFGALPFALPAMAESNHYSYADIVRRLYDTSELTKIPQEGERSDQFSSYDRSSQYDESGDCYLNWHANYDGTGYLYETEDGGLVLAEMDGPGYISRMWLPYTTQNQIKIYIDGSDTPVIDTSYINLVYGMFKQYSALSFNTAPIQTNTTGGQNQGGFDNYVPITYNRSCRVVMYGDPIYYLISYTTLSQGSTVESFTSTMSDTNKNALQTANDILNQPSLADPEAKQVYQNTVAAGSSVDIYTVSGSGAVRYMDLDIDIPVEEFDPQTSLCEWNIAMYWDGSARPSVNMTVADFFGTPYGNTAYASYVMGVNEDGSMYCRWYMPYANGAKIVLTNHSDTARTVSLSLASDTLASAEDLLRFNASWQRMEELSGDRYPDAQMLYVEGTGRFAGTVLHVCQFAENYWWGEGDEKFFVDGEKFPSWYGTGSEDYFGYAWSDKGIFVTPFLGQTVCNNDLDTAFPQGAGDKVNYRFHLTDNIPFFSSFDAYMEKYARDTMTAYGVTTFFYLTPDTQSNYTATSPDMEQRIFNTLIAADAPALTYNSMQIIKRLGDYSEKVPVTQDMSGYANLFGLEWTDNIQVFWQPSSAGKYFEFSVNLPESSIYDLSAEITKAADYGTFTVSIDGITVGTPYDSYSPNLAVTEHTFGTLYLTQGTHTVQITTVERNSASAADYIGISKLEFSKPDWDVYYEGGSDLLSALKETSEGVTTQCQPLGEIWPDVWSEDQHLWITTNKPEDYAAFELNFSMSGLYDVTVSATTAGDYGTFAVYLDGQKIGEDIDAYGTVVTSKDFSLDSVAVTAGTHTLKIIATGKNEASAGYFIGIDDILFSANKEFVQAKVSAIEDIRSYKDFDNYDARAQQELNNIVRTTVSSILETSNMDSIEAILTSAKAEMDKIESISVHYGDINDDGSANAADALLALRHCVNRITLKGEAAIAADVNLDGLINALDALYILRYTVGRIKELPVA